LLFKRLSNSGYDKPAQKNEQKIVLFGCSIGKENLNDTKIQDLKKFDIIVARESLTYRNLLEIGIDEKSLFLHTDPAFTLKADFSFVPKEIIENETIGINISPLSMLYEKNNGASMAAVENLIKYIIENTGFKIALIPHVIKEGIMISLFYRSFMKNTKYRPPCSN
jgi:polysaccharide pyruvyl transferase WcaK-like protein